jgi:pimeloyl-ACP methyl ester carboxylesterase
VEFRTITGRDQRYVISQAGAGADVLLVHGFPDTPHSFAEIGQQLVSDGWRVTVPWLRGYHRETIVPGRPYDPETIGRDALGLLDAIDTSEAVIVGHDWGALAAYAAAALAPERVRATVTIGIPHPSVLRRTPAALWAVRHFFLLKLPGAERACRRNDFAYLDQLYTRWAPNWSGPERERSLADAKQALSTPETLAGAIGYYRALPLGGTPLLDRAAPVPGLVIGGTEDLADPDLFTRTAEVLPQPSRALVVAGAGHWPHREQPAVVVPELRGFLAGLSG